MDRARYILAVLLVVTLPPALLWWFLIHPFTDVWRRVGARLTLTLMTLLFVAGAGFLYSIRHFLVGRDLGTHWLPAVAGLVFVGLAFLIALERRKQLTFSILAGLPQLDPARKGPLLTEGIYAVIRHPRYVEVALGTVGYALLANYSGTYILAALTLPALHGIVLLEERELEDRFGDEYRAYRERVPRYIPKRRASRAG